MFLKITSPKNRRSLTYVSSYLKRREIIHEEEFYELSFSLSNTHIHTHIHTHTHTHKHTHTLTHTLTHT